MSEVIKTEWHGDQPPGGLDHAAPLIVADSGPVRILTLNRPEVHNALDLPLIQDLTTSIREADADPAVHAVVLTGAGRSFCSGLDLTALRTPRWDPSAWGDAVAALLATSVPVIAAVNGPARTAGLGLVLACDFAIASETATFADTHARVGLLSGSGSAALLAERIGMPRAKEMWITAKVIDASTAHVWGLVNDVVSSEQLAADVSARAAASARYDNTWVRTTIATHELGRQGTLSQHLQIEAEAAARWAGRKQ
jgi:enoyl-CoA hydratase